MKKFLWIALIVLIHQGVCPAQTGDKNFIDQNYIEVTGKAILEVVPDEIFIRIVLDERDNKGKLSVEELEKSLMSVLKKMEIDPKDALSMRDATSNYKQRKVKRPDILTKKEYILRVNDAMLVSDLFAALEEAGISNVAVERTEHSEMEKFRREVKINAIKAAKEKAEALTSAIGQGIGRAIYIYEYPDREIYPALPMANTVKGIAADESLALPGVDFEKIRLNYSVMVRFELN